MEYKLSPDQKKVIQYIKNTVIDVYMLGDLKRIVDLPILKEGGNCNFPIVLYIFSCVEFLGTLTSEVIISDNQQGATQRRIWAYMRLTFGEHFQAFQQHENVFVQIFRNGLSHEFFAKNSGVSRKETSLFGATHGGKLSLDADRFYKVFYDSCDTLKSLIDESRELAERISERYLSLQQRNREHWSFVRSTHTQVSGATVARQSTPDSCMTTPSYPPDDDV